MSTHYQFGQKQLDEFLDETKVLIIGALVNEGIMTLDDADRWAELHTVIYQKKGFFRTLRDKWLKANGDGHMVIVKKVVNESFDEPRT